MRNRKTLAGSALCLGVIAGILAGGILVHAQGTGAGEISACVLPGTAANVRIIGAGERCPTGTPVNWNTHRGLPVRPERRPRYRPRTWRWP
jgi:hypothetical protein